MKSVKMILIVAVSLLAGSLIAENGKGCGPHKGEMCGPHGMRDCIMSRVRDHIFKALDLTEEQKEQAKAIRKENEEKIKKYAEAAFEAHKAIRKASEADKIDEQAIRELAHNAADAMAEIAIIRAEMKKEFEAILTDEQKAKLEEKKAEMKERMEMMKKRFQKGKDSKKGCDKE